MSACLSVLQCYAMLDVVRTLSPAAWWKNGMEVHFTVEPAGRNCCLQLPAHCKMALKDHVQVWRVAHVHLIAMQYTYTLVKQANLVHQALWIVLQQVHIC
jgi:hypothetical protein